MRFPSPLCSLRPLDGIMGAGGDSALDRAAGSRGGWSGSGSMAATTRESPQMGQWCEAPSRLSTFVATCAHGGRRSRSRRPCAQPRLARNHGKGAGECSCWGCPSASSRRPSSQPSPAARWATHDTWRSLECVRLDSPALPPTCNSSGDAQRGRIEQGLLQHHHATE